MHTTLSLLLEPLHEEFLCINKPENEKERVNKSKEKKKACLIIELSSPEDHDSSVGELMSPLSVARVWFPAMAEYFKEFFQLITRASSYTIQGGPKSGVAPP